MKHGLPILERIEHYYIPEPNLGCWLWLGALRGNGKYPTLNIEGKSVSISQWIYKKFKGRIPKGHEIRHTCDIRICVNPDHLLTGTHAQNMKDASIRKRFPPRHGEHNATAVLNNEQVLAIRNDPRGCTTVGREYGVHKTLIWLIRKRKVWKHLP